MLVKYWMSRDPVTVCPEDSMQTAIDLMKKNRIRLLPVLKNYHIVGVITDRDLKRASASDATTLEIHELLYLLAKIKVGDIMSRPAITIPHHYTIEEAAEVMMEQKISGAPVVEDYGTLAGVITQSDLFRAMVTLTGLVGRGHHFALMIEDRPGSIMEIANLIRAHGGRMVSILTTSHRSPPGLRRVYFRVYDLKRSNVDDLLEQMRCRGRLLYLVDHRENRREIFAEPEKAVPA